ncbi:MAG: DUF4423 domain-containing protein [Bdellovibrionota bacterium]
MNENDYRSILRYTLLEYKEKVSKSFTFKNMADACRVQKAYLSTVLKGHGHLSEDQLYAACRYLGMSKTEESLLQLLMSKQKTIFKHRISELDQEIDKTRSKLSNTKEHLGEEVIELSTHGMSEYFLNPTTQLIHMMLSIDKYASSLSEIAKTLNISESFVSHSISTLTRLGLTELSNGSYRNKERNLHLSKDSPIFKAYRSILRSETLRRLDSDSDTKSYSFSAMFSGTETTRDFLHQKLLELIKEAQSLSNNGDNLEIFHLNIDLFRWT